MEVQALAGMATRGQMGAAGIAAASLAVAAWGLGNVLVKFIDLPGLGLAMDRLWIGVAIAAALSIARRQSLTLRKLRVALPGGIAFATNMLLFFSAVKLTSVADATIIATLQPAMLLVVVGPLFGERVLRSDLAWTAVAIGGTAMVVVGSAHTSEHGVAGDLLATGALLAWAWYFVASKRARRELSTIEYQMALTLVAAVVATPVALISGSRIAPVQASTWGLIVLLAVGPGGGHYLMNWAHRHTTLSTASLLTLAMPVVAAIGALVVLGESLGAVQLVGMAVVMGALAVVIRARSGRADGSSFEVRPAGDA